jgi:hypothetical protein
LEHRSLIMLSSPKIKACFVCSLPPNTSLDIHHTPSLAVTKLHTWKLNHGQTIWDKKWDVIGNVLRNLLVNWEHFENQVEHIGNRKKHKNLSPPPPPKTQKKKIKPPLSLLIGCMKFLFPQRIVTIFKLDCYSHYKLGVLIVHAYILCFALIRWVASQVLFFLVAMIQFVWIVIFFAMSQFGELYMTQCIHGIEYEIIPREIWYI